MPVRATSKAAYIDVVSDKKTARDRRKLLSKIVKYPGLTRKELSGCTDLEINIVTPRIRELLNCGALREDGFKKDPITKKSLNKLYVNFEPRMRRANICAG